MHAAASRLTGGTWKHHAPITLQLALCIIWCSPYQPMGKLNRHRLSIGCHNWLGYHNDLKSDYVAEKRPKEGPNVRFWTLLKSLLGVLAMCAYDSSDWYEA